MDGVKVTATPVDLYYGSTLIRRLVLDRALNPSAAHKLTGLEAGDIGRGISKLIGRQSFGEFEKLLAPQHQPPPGTDAALPPVARSPFAESVQELSALLTAHNGAAHRARIAR